MEVAEITFLDIQENETYVETVKQILNKCYAEENLQDKKIYTDVVLTNSKNIRELNKKFRDIDAETDVLSFPMFEKGELAKITGRTPEVLGDIVVSIEQVEKQAEEYGHGMKRELSYMIVHSFYHLMGYDHMNEDDKAEMREKEEKILKGV